jgi:PKD repeat protein
MDNKRKLLALFLICVLFLSVAPFLATSADVGYGNSTYNNSTYNNWTHHNSTHHNSTDSGSTCNNSTYNINKVTLLTANFTAKVTSGKAPLNVLFTSNCTGNHTGFNWTFGDGEYSKQNLTSIHTYTKPGKYDVSLTVTNGTDNVTATKLSYINVTNCTAVCQNVSKCTKVLCTGKALHRVRFLDRSKNHVSTYWNFGDGKASRSKSIVHIYKKPGKYPVKFTVKYKSGNTKTINAGYIVVTGYSHQSTTTPTSSPQLTQTSMPSSTPTRALTPTPTSTPTESSNSVYISAFYVGAPNQTEDQEYVQIKNNGTTAVNINGWTITDEGAKHVYTFSSYTLSAESMVTLISGLGTNNASTLYWNKDIFIWNNDGDTAYLYNAQGKLVSSKSG